MAESLVIWSYFGGKPLETYVDGGMWGMQEEQWIEKAFLSVAKFNGFTEEETASTLADILQNKDYELIGIFAGKDG